MFCFHKTYTSSSRKVIIKRLSLKRKKAARVERLLLNMYVFSATFSMYPDNKMRIIIVQN